MKKTKRPGVMFYADWLEMFREMQPGQVAAITIAALDFGLNGIEPDFSSDAALRMCWSLLRQRIQLDNERYLETCKENELRGKYGAYKVKRARNGEAPLSYDEWLLCCDGNV